MHIRRMARPSRRGFIWLAAALAGLPEIGGRLVAQAVPGAVPLDQMVVSATRTPTPADQVGSSVSVISEATLAREQITTLSGALDGAAGVSIAPSGAPGASASLFLRGANSDQTLFLVDGIRMSGANTDYAVFLGGAAALPSDTIAIDRGPQSSLYGGEAVGGVIDIETQPGHGAPSGMAEVTAGSFGTIEGLVNAQGQRGAWDWNVSAQHQNTDNQRPNNHFSGTTYALRLDRRVGDRVTLGMTGRGFFSLYGDPGDRFTNDPDNHDREQNQLATVFADYTISPYWSGRLTLGGQDRRFVSVNPTPGQPTETTVVTNRRAVLDWQNTFVPAAGHRLTAGLTAEHSHTRNNGFGDIDQGQNLLAFFAQDEWTPTDRLFLTAGLRSDDHDTFGRVTTGRATAAWLVLPRRLKLRASYGTGFQAPSFLDLYGQNAYYVGNPRLAPERVRGWDAGFDLYLAGGTGTVSATWFQDSFRDLIIDNFSVFPATTANVDAARTQGLELSATKHLKGQWDARVAYTYLEAEDLTQHTRLLRRPRHTLSVEIWTNLGHGFSLGGGVLYVADRMDVDARTFATIKAPNYSVARLYGAWKVSPRTTIKVRIENLFDEHYEPVDGYPALGARVLAGLETRF